MARIKKRSLPEINAGSMADIAFLLLIFFIVATTMDVDSGLLTKLPPMPVEDTPPPDINERNIFQVLVNANDKILVEEDWGDIETLKDKAKEFITNNGRNPNLSDNPEKAVISLQNDRGTSYDMYIQVQNELKKAYNEIRDAAAREKFGAPFDNLTRDQQREIQEKYPMKISEAEPKNIGGN